jgi:ANTAR domain/PAS fold
VSGHRPDRGRADLEAEPSGTSVVGEVERALAAGAPERVGWFRYFFPDERHNEHWEWSPQVERMYGYQPGTVAPTTALVGAHQHPEDYRQIPDTLALIRQTHLAFSSRHRVRDVHGNVRQLVVVGDQLCDDAGTVVGIHGFFIDVTREELARQDQVTAMATNISQDQAVIEQAKGMLMLIYGTDAATALELLKWRSQETHVKLRQLCEQLTADFHAARRGTGRPPQAIYDKLLLTVHQRIRRNGSN